MEARSRKGLGIAVGAVVFASCTGAGPVSAVVGTPDEPVALCEPGETRLDERWAVTSTGGVDAFATGGRSVAIAGTDGAVRVWSVGPDGAELSALLPFEDASGYSGGGCRLAFDRSGEHLAVAHIGIVEVWSVADAERTAVLRLGSTWVSALAVSDGGGVVAVADVSQAVSLWTPATDDLSLVPQELAATELAFVSGTKDLVVAGTILPGGWGSSPVVQRFDAGDGWTTASSWGCGDVRAMALSPDGHTAFAAGVGSVVRVDLDDPEGGIVFQSADWLQPRAIAASPDGGTFAAIGDEGTLRVWSAATLEEVSRRDLALQVGIAFDATGDGIHAIGRDGVIRSFGCAE